MDIWINLLSFGVKKGFLYRQSIQSFWRQTFGTQSSEMVWPLPVWFLLMLPTSNQSHFLQFLEMFQFVSGPYFTTFHLKSTSMLLSLVSLPLSGRIPWSYLPFVHVNIFVNELCVHAGIGKHKCKFVRTPQSQASSSIVVLLFERGSHRTWAHWWLGWLANTGVW